MKTFISTSIAVAALFLGVASCGNNGPTATNNPAPVNLPGGGGGTGGTVTYQQIERLATPALKEATESFADHQATNMQNPYTELNGGTLPTDAAAFLTNVAKRNSQTVGAIAKLVFPDVMIADLSQTAATASYFGVQTGGHGPAPGNTFGGRALTDDVIDVDLGVIFGSTLAQLNVVPDDNNESPCLTTDNVPGPNNAQGWTQTAQVGAGKNESTTFPYAGTPY